MASGPLAGIRVLEFSLIVAGPATGINLSDLGADVIKVEPPGGEAIRQSGAVVPNESKAFQGYNRGKRGIIVDLADPRGLEVIERLMPNIDVVTSNYRPGVAERLGIDYESLVRLRPDLVYLEATGFGASGPASSLGGSDIVAQAYSGLMAGDAKVDEHGAPQTISATPVSDYGTALGSAMGICAALFHRERTGEGQLIQASLLRSALFLQANAVMREPVTDAVSAQPMLQAVEEARAAGGSYADVIGLRQLARRLRASMRIFYGGYRARDGGLVLGALTPATRNSIRRILGLEGERSDDPDFDAADPENQAGVEAWLDTVRSRMAERPVAEWIEEFGAAGVPASAVQLPEELADDPQVLAEGMMTELEHSVTGPQRVVGPIVTMSKTPTEARLPAPALGEHTREVLTEFGFARAEVEALEAAGVIEQGAISPRAPW
ncbi:MAG: CoA transferase [Chloroflexi bacterium]|nr:CoA transferase [Chloroflexota bacterium]